MAQDDRLPIVRGEEVLGHGNGGGIAATAQERLGPAAERARMQAGRMAHRADELAGQGAETAAQGLRTAADFVQTSHYGRWFFVGGVIVLILLGLYVFGGNSAPQFLTVIPYENPVDASTSRFAGNWSWPVEHGVDLRYNGLRFDRWDNGPIVVDGSGNEIGGVLETHPESGAQRWTIPGAPLYFKLHDGRNVMLATSPSAW